MPKQLIASADYGRTVPLDGTEAGSPVTLVELDRDMVKVGWDKQRGSVQLAVLQTFEDVLVEHGFELDEIADGLDPIQAGQLQPHYINLDRTGLNTLIRTLRQARDDAFGKDA